MQRALRSCGGPVIVPADRVPMPRRSNIEDWSVHFESLLPIRKAISNEVV